MFSLQQNQRKGLNRFCLEARSTWGQREVEEGRGGEMTQTNVCTYEYMNKEKTKLSPQRINIPVKIWAHELNREVSKKKYKCLVNT
jgi:hypothetical protein